MDISSIFLMLFAAVCVICLVCVGYLFVYKKHINKALIEPDKKHIKLVPPYKVLLALVILLAVVGTSYAVTIIPNMEQLSTVNDIEDDARSFQKIITYTKWQISDPTTEAQKNARLIISPEKISVPEKMRE